MGMMINRRRVYGGAKHDDGHEYIDLGLPSGTLWAKGNIVKDEQGNYSIGNETDYGCYFSWGNIDGHNNGEGYSFDSTNYNNSPGKELTGNISPTDAEHDAAVARLGGNWHMPTAANFQELYNSNYTTSTFVTQNGVAGRLVTSKINGNSIFLPAAGYYDGSTHSGRNSGGYYWSASRYSNSEGYYLNFDRYSAYPKFHISKNNGLSVRAVKSV